MSYPTHYQQGSHFIIDHNSMVVTAKSPQQQAQSNQTAQVIRPGATTKQVMKQQSATQNGVVIKNKQQPVTPTSTPTTTVGQTGQTVRKIIRHDSTSSDSNQTVQGQQAMKSALTTSPRPQTVLSPATQQQQQATSVVDYQRQAVPAMPIRAQMIGGPQMAKGGLIYYAAPNGLTAAGPGGSFLPYTQPIPLRTVHDNNNAFPKIATQGSTAYVHMIGNQPIVSQASNQQPQYVPTSGQTIQMITSTQQSSSPDMFTIKPSILNRKRPQAPVVVQQSTPPPPVSTNTTTTRDSSNPPNSKQAKLETPSTSSSPGLDQPVNIKVASKLKYEHTVIRSPQRNRRKQILDIASPLRTASPAISTSTIAPDKAVDDVSTDDADEWENEHPKEMKLSFEESPAAVVQSPTATPTTHTALPRYRKFQKDSNNQRRASLNQSNSTPTTTTTPVEPAKEPKVAARAHRTRQPSKVQKTQPQTPKVKSHRAQMGWEKRESSSLHFMCDDHVSRLCGEVLDERPLRNRELKEQARCCIFKLNLLNRELAKCQTDHKVLQTRFSRQKSKARVFNYVNLLAFLQ